VSGYLTYPPLKIGPICTGTVLVLLAGASAVLVAQQGSLSEEVLVSRALLDVRVIDERGQPVRGLAPADFQVTIGGRDARVETVVWTGEPSTPYDPVIDSEDLPPGFELKARGQLIIFLIQKNLQAGRAYGLLRVLRDSAGLLNQLSPDDRVAVLSLDPGLKIWTDFTGDLVRVERILREGVMFGEPSGFGAVPATGLASAFDGLQQPPNQRMEKVLVHLGKALEDLPGSKSIVVLGHGFGDLATSFGATSAGLGREYDEVRAVLEKARVAVFCLDITQADYHSLEYSLKVLAEDTGGLFVSTYSHKRRAIAQVSNALLGHYVLLVEPPILEPGPHGISVELMRSGTTVLARRTYME